MQRFLYNVSMDKRNIKPIKGKIKIKVQSQISPIVLIFALFVIFAILAGLVYLMFHSSSSRSGHGVGELVAVLVLLIPLLVQNAVNKEEYVSDIEISNKDLTLIYKQKRKFIGKEVIPIKDIQSFNVVVTSNISSVGRTRYTNTSTFVVIKTVNGEIEFEEDSSAKFSFCGYSFILNLLKISYYLPNFSYKFRGNAIDVKDDIDYFAIHGRRIPFIKKFKDKWKKMDFGGKFATCFFFFFIFLSLGGLGFIAYLNMPPILSQKEKQFMYYFNNGYNARQNEDYKTALEMFNKAEELYDKDPEIFYQKAYCYEETGDYYKAISVAKEGLNYLNSKSIYKKANKYNFNLHFDLYLYSVIADSNYKIGNYKEAKDAYSYIISNGTNKYYYFKRGLCEYYLGEYKEAMSDFLTYKAEIEDKTARGYQWYSAKDFEKVQKWIDSTTEMMKNEEKL